MKIAIVHNLPPGGQKRALFEQVKRLSNLHKLDLLTLSSTDENFLPLKPFVEKHFTVKYEYPSQFPFTIWSILKELKGVYRNLGEKINAGNYDVAYINPCYLTQAPYVLRFLKIPSVYYCPEPKREFYEKIPRVSNRFSYNLTYPFRIIIKQIDQENTRFATKILTNSEYSQKRIDEIYKVKSVVNNLGVDREKFRRINYSTVREVMASQDQPATSEVSLIKRENFVLSVGDLSLLKGHDFVIRALAEIPVNLRPKLIIAAHGGIEKNYLQKLAKEFQVDLDIKLNISDEELIKLYNRAKLFLYAPLREPFGMVILEAMACGLFTVAVKEGGIGEIIKSEKLGILTGRNIKNYARAIQNSLNKNINGKYLRSNIIKQWNWDKSVRELEEFLLSTSGEAPFDLTQGRHSATPEVKLNMPKIFIVILNYNGFSDTAQLLPTLKKLNDKSYRLQSIIVDNGSNSREFLLLKKLLLTSYKSIKLIENGKNLGFARGNNIGIRYALDHEADYVLLLNNDTKIEMNFLKNLLQLDFPISSPVVKFKEFKNKPKLIYDLGGFVNRWTGRTYHLNAYKEDLYKYKKGMDSGSEAGMTSKTNYIEADYVAGCCMLIGREVFEKIGLLDEKYFIYFEDVDFCITAIKNGFKVIVDPKSVIYHKLGGSMDRWSKRAIYRNLLGNFIFITKHLGWRRITGYVYLAILTVKIIRDRLLEDYNRNWRGARHSVS